MCVTDRCPAGLLSTTVLLVRKNQKETVMPSNYTNPALEAELAYRREVLQRAGRRAPSRRGPWLSRRRRAA
jgi:hypothetical protein